MKYKNYEGSIEFSPEDHVLFGKVQFIRPLLSYSGDSLTELETQFHEVVDEYLADCRIDGVQPEKPVLEALTSGSGKTCITKLPCMLCSVNRISPVATQKSTERWGFLIPDKISVSSLANV